MRKFATSLVIALMAVTALATSAKEADARRYRGALAFGIASAVIGGAIIASHRRAHGYYGGYGYGYGYPYYGYHYGPRYSAYYSDYEDHYPYYAPPRRYYYGGYRVIRPYRYHRAKWRHHGRRHYGHKSGKRWRR
jgi:hypothetical protein